MRIVYLGNFQHAHCTEVHLARELEGLGHEVDRMQEPPGGGTLQTVRELGGRAEDADMVLWTRTWGMPSDETTALWRRLDAKGKLTVTYHLDLYLGLKRQAGIARDPFWTTAHVFTPDGDPSSETWFREHGINHHWMPPAIVSDECVPGVVNPKFEHDVIFVGSPGNAYHEEWPWRGKLLDSLAVTYGRQFRRYGPLARTIRNHELNSLYASAKVIVGDSLAPVGHCNYFTDRYFETIGRGGFLIGPRVPGIEAFLTDGQHLRYYEHGNLDGLHMLIEYYLDSPHERTRIAARGQEHVRQHHTYRHRLARMIQVVTA